MSDHQTIIVYRNPLEQYLWESGLGVAVILGMAAAGLTAITLNWLFEQYNRRLGRGWHAQISKTQSNVIVILAIVAGVLPVHLMLR